MWKIGLSIIASYFGYEKLKQTFTKSSDIDDDLNVYGNKGWQQYPINYPNFSLSAKLSYHISQFTWQMGLVAGVIYYTTLYLFGKKIQSKKYNR
jgi:hypothetical protein